MLDEAVFCGFVKPVCFCAYNFGNTLAFRVYRILSDWQKLYEKL